MRIEILDNWRKNVVAENFRALGYSGDVLLSDYLKDVKAKLDKSKAFDLLVDFFLRTAKETGAGGLYLGLFQHSAETWPDSYREWTRPAWGLDESALSGRTNAIVTIRMVRELGGWKAAGSPAHGC